MTDSITAANLMKQDFLRLGAGHSLHEALGILLDPQAAKGGPRVLIILNPDGSFAGTLTVRYLLKALLPDWLPLEEQSGPPTDFEQRLFTAIQDKLHIKVAEAMHKGVPTASPADRLPTLIALMRDKKLDCLPVLDQDRVVGVIHISDVFNAAAQLALSVQDEKN